MEMKKSIIPLIIVSFVALLVAVTILCVLLPRHKDGKFAKTMGVWLWDERAGDEYLQFAYEKQIDEIYYCAESFSQINSTFIEKAHSKNMKVYLLCGDYRWIEEPSGLVETISQYNEFNNQYPTTRFEGIHLDVEPHQFADFEGNKDYYMQKYVEFVYDITATYTDIKFDFDIPSWFNTIVTMGEEEKNAYKFVFDYADRVFVMSYRDSAEQIYQVAKDELEYAKSINKPIFLSVETGREEDIVTFETEGKAYMYKELKKLKSLVNQEYGLSIHHLKSWYKLKD